MVTETPDAMATLRTSLATPEGNQMFSFYPNSEHSLTPNIESGGNRG